jgi:hypothetical protein
MEVRHCWHDGARVMVLIKRKVRGSHFLFVLIEDGTDKQ